MLLEVVVTCGEKKIEEEEEKGDAMRLRNKKTKETTKEEQSERGERKEREEKKIETDAGGVCEEDEGEGQERKRARERRENTKKRPKPLSSMNEPSTLPARTKGRRGYRPVSAFRGRKGRGEASEGA